MIISDFSYLEVVSEASNIVGGQTTTVSAEAKVAAVGAPKKPGKPTAIQANASTNVKSGPNNSATIKEAVKEVNVLLNVLT